MRGENFDALREQLRAFEGRALGAATHADDPVNIPAIRRWVEAIGDTNPIYLDGAAAIAAGRTGIVAPPAMLMVWPMKGYRATLDESAGARRGIFAALADAGFDATPATRCVHHYQRELRPGDLLSEETIVASVSEAKNTAMGRGYFIALQSTYRDQNNETVGTQTLHVFAFRSSERATVSPRDNAASAAPIPQIDNLLPPIEITLDRMAVIACSLACGDFRAGHCDPAVAQALGMRDIFTDIATSMGFVQRWINTWAGPAAKFRSIDLRLGTPCCAGDTLRLSGRIEQRRDSEITVQVQGDTNSGPHLTGTVVLTV